MKTSQPNVIILAAGRGSRNAQFTLNDSMPKLLQTIGKVTMLEQIVDDYAKLNPGRYIIVCRSDQRSVIEDFIEFKGLSNHHRFAYYINDNFEGTTITLLNALQDIVQHHESAPAYVTWSDVSAPAELTEHTTVFVDSKNRHRHHLSESMQLTSPDSGGNVCGIFYLSKELCDTMLSEDIQGIPDNLKDFDSYLLSKHNTRRHVLRDVIDIGDASKYHELRTSDNAIVSRYFNQIEFAKDVVHKYALTDQALDLQNLEEHFYQLTNPFNTPMAEMVSREGNKLTLRRIKGESAQSWFLKNKHDRKQVRTLYNAFKEATEVLLQLEPWPLTDLPLEWDKRAALRDELVNGLTNRVRPMAKLIEKTIQDHNLKTFNGLPINPDFDDILARVEKWLEDFEPTWGFVHGDTNTDNTMVQEDGRIRFIDPRGYFGSGMLPIGYGFQEYDIAKFVYGLTGYSEFNAAEYITTTVNDGAMWCYLSNRRDDRWSDFRPTQLIENHNIQVLIAIIWMRLTSYISNDPAKSVAAYLRGNSLLTKLLS